MPILVYMVPTFTITYFHFQLGSDLIDAHSSLHGAYFHYHHDEVQYWATVLSQISSGEQTLPKTVADNSGGTDDVGGASNSVEETEHNNLRYEWQRKVQINQVVSIV